MFMDRMIPRPAPARPRRAGIAAMATRAVTALVGGYTAAAVLATLLARLLPVDRTEATIWGMILSFIVYAMIGLWCFHEPRLARVASWVWGIAIGGGALLYWLGIRP